MNRKYNKETQEAIDKAWPVFLGAMIICGIMCVIIGSGILAFTLHVGSMHKNSVRSSETWQVADTLFISNGVDTVRLDVSRLEGLK